MAMDLSYNVAGFPKRPRVAGTKFSKMIPPGNSHGRFFSLLFLLFLFVASPAAWADMTHIVKKGETLSAIAQKYRVPVSRIQKENRLENTIIRVGQSLTIPVKSNLSLRSKGSLSPAGPGQEIPDTYVVKTGDTLSQIAQRHGLSVGELQELNELKGTRLKPGQVLQLKGEEEVAEGPQRKAGEGEWASALRSPDGSAIPVPQAADRIEASEVNPLVAAAQTFLGVKYRRGGSSLKTGFDCSAYVQKVFRVVGVDLPRTAREQFGVGMEVARDALLLGDLVFFKHSKASRPAHVGIYIGNDQFIHSSTTKRKIRVDSLNTRYFSTRFIGGRRIEAPKSQPDASPAEKDYSQVSNLNFDPSLSVPLISATPPSTPTFYPDL